MTRVTWSIPERQMGRKRLPPLPYDVYNLILGVFRFDPEEISMKVYKITLANCTLVCRLFYHLATPRLFEVFDFEGDDDGEPHRGTAKDPRQRWITELIRGNTEARALAATVKQITLINWRKPCRMEKETLYTQKRLKRLTLGLRHFISIRSVSLASAAVGLDLFTALATLPRLRKLLIRDCEFEPVGTSVVLPTDGNLALESLEVTLVDNVHPYVSALVSLAGTRSLKLLRTTEWAIARGVMEQDIDMPLEQLEVPLQAKDVAILSAFLDRTPSIRDLSIIDVSQEQGLPRQICEVEIKDSSLPNLEKLRCPTYLLAVLSHRRPISALSLLERSDNFNYFDRSGSWSIVRSRLGGALERTALQTLEVPSQLYATYPLAESVPELETLSICFPTHASPTFTSFVKDICGLRKRKMKVCNLLLCYCSLYDGHWAFDLKAQHNLIVSYLEEEFPTASCISLVESLEWRRDEHGSKWTPIIRAQAYEYFRSTLLMMQSLRNWCLPTVRDHDGVLTKTFKDDPVASAVLNEMFRLQFCAL